jgi:predicted secreted protein
MAKTTGKINGTLILVDADGSTIGCSTNATLTITNERLETTCKDDGGAKTYTVGSQDWSISAEGMVIYETPSNHSTIAALALGQTEATWTFGTSNSDDPVFTGDGFIDNLEITAGLNTPATWSFSVAPTGPLTMTNT